VMPYDPSVRASLSFNLARWTGTFSYHIYASLYQ
jgi:hypothetical protein